ncbi:hypothetical protein [Pseudomonas sp. EA_65y_Pfl2_P74]|uniref:hypothetical protein n=1 Tax=Pseudomonas sp. EA_65y_Pfl2_P74 TaxID=3088694 RepID=UPI0030DB0FD7
MNENIRLDEQWRSGIIQKGRFLDQDTSGFILPLGKPVLAGTSWENIVAKARERYTKEYGKALHSLYLRGSVARGQAIPGNSDLDMIGLLHYNAMRDKYLAWHHVDWENTFSIELNADLCFNVKPDFVVASMNRGFLERNNSLPSILATQSTCIYGTDIREHLPKFRSDEAMMYYNGRMKLFLLDCYSRLTTDPSPQSVVEMCRNITKAMIRCAFELVLIREGRYTRDLYLCCTTFEKHHPEKAELAWNSLRLYINPCQNISRLLSLIYEFGHWLVLQERTIELRHRPTFAQRILHETGARRAGLISRVPQ